MPLLKTHSLLQTCIECGFCVKPKRLENQILRMAPPSGFVCPSHVLILTAFHPTPYAMGSPGRPENCSAGGGVDMNARRRRGGGVGEMDVRAGPLNKGQFCRFV